jgi:putative hydrolase of the HAD superfamily
VTRARLVTFDGDDTLWELAPVIERALLSSCALFGRHFPDTLVTPADLHGDRLAVHEELPDDSPMRAYRRAAYRRRVDLLGGGSEELVDELTEHFQLQRSALIEPYPDALGMLDRLAPHACLGLISNGNADVELTAFAGRFALRLHAHADGPLKPDRALFDLALARTGFAADAAVHVGDSLLHDVAGAQAAGWKAVWLNRDGSPNETGIAPDAEVATLDELDEVLERLLPRG